MNSDKESEIPRIVEKLTTTGKKTLDEDLMKKLKSIIKTSDQNVEYCYYALLTQLRKGHSEIRYSALLIINELFCRSSVFRKLLVIDLEEFLELVVETNPDNPLPLPQPRAKEMRIKGLEFMKMWTTKFGEKYIRLQLALKFLQNCKKMDFNDMEARSVAERERQQQEQERTERVLSGKITKIQSAMIEVSEDVSNILTQMENCFRLLVPHPAEDFASLPEDTPSTSHCLRQHGIHDAKSSITIQVEDIAVKTDENTLPVIDNLNDLYKQMNGRYYPLVTSWLKTLTKGSRCTDALKKAIDLRNLMESALQKYRELNIKPDVSKCEEDDDDDLIEVKEKDGYEAHPTTAPPVQGVSEPSCPLEKALMWKLKHSEEETNDPTSAAATLSKRRKGDIPKYGESMDCAETKIEKKNNKSQLLEKAPVLPYDIDLYHWEEEKPIVPERVKFDSLHKFWETKDEDNEENEALKEAQIASLRTRKIDFSGKFEPVKWSCRAPLASGKLCPRRDRYKCPFHGRIVRRDAAGNPADAGDGPSALPSPVPDWQDPALLQDIEAATGINLKMPQKGRKSNREIGLTNINKMKTSARDRLSKKILKRYKHYAKKLDDMERKKFNDKFGDQWNYY